MRQNDKHRSGAAPAVTCVEVDAGRPLTFANSEVAADFIIHHFSEITKVHSVKRPPLPTAAESRSVTEADSHE